jgi:hypothetical protein
MKQKDNPVIDLKPLGGRVYVGRPNGVKARSHFKLEELERNGKFPITIQFPEDARTMTSSFFLGMFGISVRLVGSKEGFLKKYKFETSQKILEEINNGIMDALISR